MLDETDIVSKSAIADETKLLMIADDTSFHHWNLINFHFKLEILIKCQTDTIAIRTILF